MSILFIFPGVVRSFVHGSEKLELEGKEGKSIETVCREIGLPSKLPCIFFVNGNSKTKDYLLEPNDVVKVVGLVGGG